MTINLVDKPSILDIINEYFPETNLKIRGKKGIGFCPFHGEKTPSFHVYIDQKRFHCFSCKKSGDSLDLMSYATSKPLVDILREYGSMVPSEEIIQRRRDMEVRRQFKEDANSCWLRILKLYRSTYEVEKKCKGIPSDENLSLMADAFFIRNLTGYLLDKLESKNSAEVKQGLNESRQRGLFT
jgi:hypothetical protein